MKIRYVSDLHIEFDLGYNPFELKRDKNATLILAGDVYVGTKALPFIKDCLTKFKQVIYICGNHEFYTHDINKIINFWKDIDIPNFYFLENNFVELDGIRFIGTTLWTDFDKEDWFSIQTAKRGMNDFHIIGYNKGRFMPEDSIEKFKNAAVFIDFALKTSKLKNIVITHHLPSLACISLRFKTSTLNGAFASDLNYLIEKYDIEAWIHGHTHDTIELNIFDTKILCNPRGYRNENSMFDPDKYFDI